MKKNYALPMVLVCLFSLTCLAQTTWDGSESANWHTAANWDTNTIPTSADNVIIANAGNAPIISSGTLAETSNLTINTGATLTINSANSLTVSGNLIVTDAKSLILNSGSSLIVSGTSTGKLLYKRNIPVADVWYLVTNPLIGGLTEQNDFLLNDNPNIAISAGNSNPATGTYNYGGTAGWRYDVLDFSGGIGFATRLTSTADLQFTGTILTDDLAKDIFGTGDGFRLHGNPYPSYLAANSNADATNNFLTYNTNAGITQDDIESATIWFWDHTLGAAGEYTTINQISDARYIAPGQGFFVKGKSPSGGDAKVDFKENMQSHQSTDVFNKTQSNKTEIKVFISSETYTTSTEIYYIDGATTGFDNGYDSSVFGGSTASYKVYSGFVSNSQGEKLAIQSLPDTDYENMVIPIGINANSGLNIKFTTEALNLPNGINVYLEDRLKNTYVRLNETNSNYSITLTEKTSGFGRFYLHTKSSSALSTDDIALEATNIYQLDKNSLRVTGINSDVASIKIYSILGKQVLDQSFSSKGNSDISLPNLNTGVYIVQIATEKGKTNKKIVLK